MSSENLPSSQNGLEISRANSSPLRCGTKLTRKEMARFGVKHAFQNPLSDWSSRVRISSLATLSTKHPAGNAGLIPITKSLTSPSCLMTIFPAPTTCQPATQSSTFGVHHECLGEKSVRCRASSGLLIEKCSANQENERYFPPFVHREWGTYITVLELVFRSGTFTRLLLLVSFDSH